MSLLSKKAVSNKEQTLEKIIGLTAGSVVNLLSSKTEAGRHEIAFKHRLLGISTENFVTSLGAAVLADLDPQKRGIWSFDLEASRELGQIEVSYGYGNPASRIWDKPALVFIRQEVVADVVTLQLREELPPLAA